MSEIEIYHKAKIFDDPDKCQIDEYGTYCGYLTEDNICSLFPADVGVKNSWKTIKCDECKTAYQKALKEKFIQACPNCGTEYHDNSLTICPACEFHFSGNGLVCVKCGKPRKIVDGGGFECPCPHCGDEIPF